MTRTERLLHLAWEFCDKTPGCTLARGHGGDCKLAKGL